MLFRIQPLIISLLSHVLNLILILLYACGWVGNTESGTRWMLQSLAPFFQLQIGSIDGQLFQQIQLKNIQYKTPALQLSAKTLVVRWQPEYLTNGYLLIHEMKAEQVSITADGKTFPSLFSMQGKQITLHRNGFHFPSFEINAGDTRFSAQGSLSDSWDFKWNFEAPHLNLLFPDASGRFSAQGSLSGSRQSPYLQTNISADTVRWKNNSISHVSLQGKGEVSNLTIAIVIRRHQEQLSAQIKGAWKNKPMRLEGKLTQLTFESPVWKRWLLKNTGESIPLILSEKNISLKHMCMASQTQTICIAGQIQDGEKLSATLSAQFNSLPQLFALIQSIQGNATPPAWLTKLRKIQGQLAINLKLLGSVSNPQISGEAHLKNARTDIPELGLQLKNIALQGIVTPNQQITVSGSLLSGAGKLNISGHGSLKETPSLLIFELTGKNIQIVHTREYAATASPQLKLSLLNNHLRISGSILIPDATLKPIDFSQQAIVLSDDVVFVSSKAKTKVTPPFSWESQLDLLLGEKIMLDYSGLQGQLRGKLHVNDSSGGATLAQGALTLEGTYNAYGTKLQIRKGLLLFTGGRIENPTLSIQADKQVLLAQPANQIQNFKRGTTSLNLNNKTTVGISVTGTLENRKVQLFSTPTNLGQADILSYLVFGYPASQATSQADVQVLFKALSTLDSGTNRFEQAKSQLESKLGLSELSFGTISPNAYTAAVGQKQAKGITIGKALSPRLHINYSLGLFEAIDVLRIRYFLWPQVTIQTESSRLSNAIDLLYSIEY